MWDQLCVSHGEDIDSISCEHRMYTPLCSRQQVEAVFFNATFLPNGSDKRQLSGKIRQLDVWAVCGGLKEKKRAFRSGNKEELKAVQKEPRKKIREGKNSYRRKMEDQLQQRNISGVWKSLKTISGLQTPRLQGIRSG